MTELAGHSKTSLVRCDEGPGVRQPHSRSAHKIALIFPAIEFVKNHSLLEIVDARGTVGHTRRFVVPPKFCGNNDRLLLLRIQISIVVELYQNVLGTLNI